MPLVRRGGSSSPCAEPQWARRYEHHGEPRIRTLWLPETCCDLAPPSTFTVGRSTASDELDLQGQFHSSVPLEPSNAISAERQAGRKSIENARPK